ncbi:MAG: adenosylcobinamide-GDP ribazoletransferase [Desulfomonilaceae bacterium]
MRSKSENEFEYATPGIRKWLRDLEISIGFLTLWRIDVSPPPDMIAVGRSSWAFPVVGALMGVTLSLFFWLCEAFFTQPVCALLTVILWVTITGGLHLDGWTDCWDALGASVSIEKRREILKDSRLGSFGAIGLILLLLAKVVTLMVIKEASSGIIIAAVTGRAMMALASQKAVTSGKGMAKDFLEGVQRESCIFCWAFTILIGLFSGITGLISIAAAYGTAFWFRRFAESRLGFINGDVLGSICELSEVTVLIMVCGK